MEKNMQITCDGNSCGIALMKELNSCPKCGNTTLVKIMSSTNPNAKKCAICGHTS